MEMVIEDVSRLENMIKKLVEMKTIETSHIEMSSINQIVSETVRAFGKDFADNNIEVKLDLADMPLIPLDKDKLKIAIANLIKNAVEAMEKTPKHLKIAASVRDEHIEITVSDTGKGIPEDKIKYIFDPFFTSKIYGPGLGLTVVRRIVQEHRGDISVKSKSGKGTTFTIRLPLRDSEITEGSKEARRRYD